MRILEIVDKTVRVIYLTRERWSHILLHDEMSRSLELIAETLRRPDRIIPSENDDDVVYYFRYYKHQKQYLLVVVKYLNGEGFVVTGYFNRNLC
ncbi:MAG TPA: PBECR2 nuclease fold domain-containing protein [Candidatus Nanoarchaeia archaeon]|nr:PBECR2 nuclease fold domain-containing protein [Candidatus Nanoarchaeia archaeon]